MNFVFDYFIVIHDIILEIGGGMDLLINHTPLGPLWIMVGESQWRLGIGICAPRFGLGGALTPLPITPD